jgi:hypothetical protein
MTGEPADIVRLEGARTALKFAFLSWQCQLRQLSARQAGGRPSDGMRPTIWVHGREVGPVTVVMNKAEDGATARQFEFMARKTTDPNERWDAMIGFMQGTHFQKPQTFDDELTALFAGDDSFPADLAGLGRCELRFAQFRQRYHLPCAVRVLDSAEPGWKATYWHNFLFNPNLPGAARILGFRPDWALAEAEPAP